MQQLNEVVIHLAAMDNEQLMAVVALAAMGVCAVALGVLHSILKGRK